MLYAKTTKLVFSFKSRVDISVSSGEIIYTLDIMSYH